MKRLFLLSPASTTGKRARMLVSSRAAFDLALRLRDGGAPIGEVFAFLSGLYFRGKLAYVRRFAARHDLVRVITCDRGLVDPDALITLADIETMSHGAIDHQHPPYRDALLRDMRELRASLGSRSAAVLLGSVATEKYVALASEIYQRRLLIPAEFVGRGDMSRGGLMLRHARAGLELEYVAVTSSLRRGRRPPKLPAIRP